MIGQMLGPYRILEKVGEGGMGEVYRARDTRLERTVAIKILPREMAGDPQRRQRFEREARTISSLNHPNICTLHDIGSEAGVDFLVMECVEGETLAKRLEKGPLPLDRVLKYGAEIADAVDKAHRAGIVHRDLKPGNIMLTPTGAKLLDFGLAKPAVPLVSGATSTTTALASPVTEQGTILGTFQYMSPEQVEGRDVDGRSDIFSLGAVLYEMVTGNRAFQGRSQLSVASAILEKEPAPISALRQMTPPALDFAVRKCLEKVPDDRWQSAGDLADQLKWILDGGERPAERAPGTGARATTPWLAWSISGALALMLIAAVVWWRSSKPSEETTYFALPVPFVAGDIAIAPNGRTVAVVAYWEPARRSVIWIYERGTREATSLAETEGASYPFWSPDGRSLAFFADGKLKKLDLPGGRSAQTLCEAPSGRGGTWNKDGVIVFAPTGQLGHGLYRVPAFGGTPTPIASPDRNRGETNLRWPAFLPDGKHFLYLASNVSGQIDVDAIYEGSLDSNEKRFVVKATANAVYVPPGYLVFYRDKTLFAQRFDPNTLALSGEPAALLTDVQYLPRIAKAIFSVADGALLLGQTGSGMTLSRPIWLDRRGRELAIASTPEPDVYSDPFLSPDGKMLAVSRTDSGSLNTDIWTLDLQKNISRRLTFDPAIDAMAVWSPDGTELVFASNHQQAFDLYLKKADGAQGERLLVHDDTDKLPNDWSRDGRHVVYTRGAELWVLTLPELKTAPFLKASGTLKNGQFSPDGRWLAYASNESGRWEVYVTSFPEAQGRWQISTAGGEQPRWRGDGTELFYLSSNGKMMAAPVTTGARFDAGAAAELFQAAPMQPTATSDQIAYDIAKDGQRFLINTQAKQTEREPISVVLNWTAKLTK